MVYLAAVLRFYLYRKYTMIMRLRLSLMVALCTFVAQSAIQAQEVNQGLQIDATCDGAIIRVVDPSVRAKGITLLRGTNLVTGSPEEPFGAMNGEFYVRSRDRKLVASGTVRIDNANGPSIERTFSIAPELIGVPPLIELGDVVAGERTTFTIRVDTPDSARVTKLAWYASTNPTMQFEPLSVDLQPGVATFCSVAFIPRAGGSIDTASVRTWCGTIRQFRVTYSGNASPSEKGLTIGMVPHPTKAGASVELQLSADITGPYHIDILDLEGKRLGPTTDGVLATPSRSLRLTIPSSLNGTGTYLLRIANGGHMYSRTFVCTDS